MSSQADPLGHLQIIYVSHGGGPLPILGDASHQALVDFMLQLPAKLPKPEAIIVISAHWEANSVTLTSAQNPSLFFDYYGFPDAAYQITYPAPGNSGLANRLVEALNSKSFQTRSDSVRGLDHGVFIPLKLMYPQADIPVLQLSLLQGLDPDAHIALGKALQGVVPENTLVVGSGFSFHNMRAFSWRGGLDVDPANDAFQNWLIETVCSRALTGLEREERLLNWQLAPSARYCHPREEHLLPLHVCQGLADKPGQLIFDDYILGKRGIAFLW